MLAPRLICSLLLHWHAASHRLALRSRVVGQDRLLEMAGHFSDNISSTSNLTQGPCFDNFNKVDPKFTQTPGIWDALDENLDDLNREKYEPKQSSGCAQSSNAGTHAFLRLQLQEALEQAPAGTAAVDIGSGTGFLLSVFKHYVKDDVTVIGIDTDHGAVEHFNSLELPGVSVIEGDALTPGIFADTPKFSVMNVGFASEKLPKLLIDLTAASATILMPICTHEPADNGKCKARFHLFKKAPAAMTDTEVGPPVNFFYVPAE